MSKNKYTYRDILTDKTILEVYAESILVADSTFALTVGYKSAGNSKVGLSIEFLDLPDDE